MEIFWSFVALAVAALAFFWVICTRGADPHRIRGPWWDRDRYDRWRGLSRPWGIVRHTGFYVAGIILIYGSIAFLTGTDAAINQAVGLGGVALLVVMPMALIIELVRMAVRGLRDRLSRAGSVPADYRRQDLADLP